VRWQPARAHGGTGQAQHTWANITLAGKLLDWAPQVSLDEGMGRLVEWYCANREWAREVATC